HAQKQGTRPLIAINGLCKRYGKFELFEQLNLDIMPQTINAVVGTNGCGKSTFLKILAAMTTFHDGHYYFDRVDALKFPKALQQKCAYCPDIDLLQNHLSVEEHLSLSLLLQKLSPNNITQAIALQKRFSVSG